jgi:uncharacterized protein
MIRRVGRPEPDGGSELPAASVVPGRGDRVVAVSPRASRRVQTEVVLLWLGVLLAIRGVVAAQKALGLHEVVLASVPFLFIYAPVLLCRFRGVDSFEYRLFIPAFRDWGAWRDALRLNLLLVGVGLVPWLVGYHLYQHLLFGYEPALRFPPKFWTAVAYHLFFVAVPEEFFYRGYLQTRLNEILPRRFLLFGVPFGHGLWITALLFAFGHSLVQLQWWHFATFFPGLLFGLLREKTGTVISGAFLHAICNVGVLVLDTMYGIR